MVRLELKHHVYSSIEGYQSIFASKGLPQEVIERVEECSRLLYPRLYGPGTRSMFPVCGYFCHSRVFRYGLDHVGRPRTCVHNILVDLSLQDSSLDPYGLGPQAFLSPDVPDQDIGYELAEAYNWPTTRETMSERVQYLLGNAEAARCFPAVLSLLQFGQPWVLRARSQEGFDLVSSVGAFLPPVLQRRLAIVSGTKLANAQVTVLSPSTDLESIDAEWTLDYPADPARLPGCSEYAALIAEYLFNRQDLATLHLIHDFLATYEESERDQYAALDRFAKVFRATERYIDREYGGLQIDAHSLETFISAVPELHLAGFSRLAESVLDWCFDHLNQSKDLRKIAEGLKLLRKSLEAEPLSSRDVSSLRRMIQPRIYELMAPKKTIRIRGVEDLTNKSNIASDLKAIVALLASAGS